jgi:predicted amidohydrolase
MSIDLRQSPSRLVMQSFRIALANLRYPATPEESVTLTVEAIAEAAREGAGIVCFPECFVPGYRGLGKSPPPPDARFLESAWNAAARAAAEGKITAVIGTERLSSGNLLATVVVIDSEGTIQGFQDKVQIDPSEEGTYTPGTGRQVFEAGPLRFGVVICHEGWRYPETVRWAAQRGAQVVFHPHYHPAEPGSYRPSAFADPANTFHEKAVLCRAAENSCYVASVNYASPGSGTTSAIARPDGSLLCCQPYAAEGLLIGDLDLDQATGLLAKRLRAMSE